MKVYSLPDELPAPEPDYLNFNLKTEEVKIQAHKEALKAWLVKAGYTGKNTGETLSFPVADGHAQYMLAEGKSSILLHLPYFDGYAYPDVAFLPKKEILTRIDIEKKRRNFFASKTG
jgi:hypothetical protein